MRYHVVPDEIKIVIKPCLAIGKTAYNDDYRIWRFDSSGGEAERLEEIMDVIKGLLGSKKAVMTMLGIASLTLVMIFVGLSTEVYSGLLTGMVGAYAIGQGLADGPK